MRSKKLNTIFSGGMYGGKNTLIVASVDRRKACSHDVTLSKNSFFDRLKRRHPERRSHLFHLLKEAGIIAPSVRHAINHDIVPNQTVNADILPDHQ